MIVIITVLFLALPYFGLLGLKLRLYWPINHVSYRKP